MIKSWNARLTAYLKKSWLCRPLTLNIIISILLTILVIIIYSRVGDSILHAIAESNSVIKQEQPATIVSSPSPQHVSNNPSEAEIQELSRNIYWDKYNMQKQIWNKIQWGLLFTTIAGISIEIISWWYPLFFLSETFYVFGAYLTLIGVSGSIMSWLEFTYGTGEYLRGRIAWEARSEAKLEIAKSKAEHQSRMAKPEVEHQSEKFNKSDDHSLSEGSGFDDCDNSGFNGFDGF